MSTDTQANTDHWYNEGWAWFVFSIPAVSVPLGIAMIVLSINTNNALVVDDYYVQGKTINQRIDRDRYATRHGISATVTASADGIQVNLTTAIDIPLPPLMLLNWIHVTESALDGSIQLLQQDSAHHYRGAWPDPVHRDHWIQPAKLPYSHRYRIHLQPADQQWRLVSAAGALSAEHSLTHREAQD